MANLTSSQQNLLQAIERLKQAMGISPTVQDITVKLGVRVPSMFLFLVCIIVPCLLASHALAEDTYRVEVTRISQDLYKIDSTDRIIKTRYCYEYSYSDDAILIIESGYGYNVGRLIFIDSKNECDVEKIIS